MRSETSDFRGDFQNFRFIVSATLHLLLLFFTVLVVYKPLSLTLCILGFGPEFGCCPSTCACSSLQSGAAFAASRRLFHHVVICIRWIGQSLIGCCVSTSTVGFNRRRNFLELLFFEILLCGGIEAVAGQGDGVLCRIDIDRPGE